MSKELEARVAALEAAVRQQDHERDDAHDQAYRELRGRVEDIARKVRMPYRTPAPDVLAEHERPKDMPDPRPALDQEGHGFEVVAIVCGAGFLHTPHGRREMLDGMDAPPSDRPLVPLSDALARIEALEGERDRAVAHANHAAHLANLADKCASGHKKRAGLLRAERDGARDRAADIERERDEARDRAADIERERDEARAEVERWQEAFQYLLVTGSAGELHKLTIRAATTPTGDDA